MTNSLPAMRSVLPSPAASSPLLRFFSTGPQPLRTVRNAVSASAFVTVGAVVTVVFEEGVVATCGAAGLP